ncbi:RING-H2 finger protein ATL79 [Apostasia shenzhenica]|uniref:RING-H2 finger protein ATL79 n=1 Tax=Apostasia shenzhenica TaxID=1088818 RepID=A0A2I0A3S1_9ASPA|nr:RING-H2 finger protein ATL79 [Apostasia shenzhenica]
MMVLDREDLQTSPPSPPAAPNKWGPYHGAGDFSANMAIVLVALLCAFALALAVNALVRHFLCRRRSRLERQGQQPSWSSAAGELAKLPGSNEEAPTSDELPTLVYSSGGGGAAECAICLLEFANGDAVRVLPTCGHGFHVACVDRWIASRRSCPTCRESCQPAPEKCGPEGV